MTNLPAQDLDLENALAEQHQHEKIRQKQNEKRTPEGALFFIQKFGGVLLSQGVYSQVPSALAGLTSVFGMGTGVTPPP